MVERLQRLVEAGYGDERMVLHVRAMPPREGGARHGFA